MSKSIFGAAVLVALSSTAAVASPSPEGPNANVIRSEPAEKPASSVAKKPTRYCVETVPTGSHMLRKYCHTREEWLRRGFDPLER